MNAAPDTNRLPDVRPVTTTDVRKALHLGVRDLSRAPLKSLFFGVVFSTIGIAISWLMFVVGSSYWVLPLAAGFPLIGPFAAVGLYEISRRIEANEPLEWGAILGAVVREGRFQLPSYAFITLFIYLIWVYLAHLIFALSFGLKPLTNVMTSTDLFLTAEGVGMLIAGTIVGGIIATVIFCISVTAVPLLLERDIDIVSAMITSVRSVLVSKGPMFLWGVINVFIVVLLQWQ